jgi:hypothetical protein
MLYSAYCLKILDVALRTFHNTEKLFGCILFEVINKLPFGFKPGTYLKALQLVCMINL